MCIFLLGVHVGVSFAREWKVNKKKNIRGFHKRKNFRIIICVEMLLSFKENNRDTSIT